MLVCLNKAFYPPNKNQKDGIQGRKGKDWRRNNIASQINWFSAKTICASCRSDLHHGQSSPTDELMNKKNHVSLRTVDVYDCARSEPLHTMTCYQPCMCTHASPTRKATRTIIIIRKWWPSSWANTFLGTLKIPVFFCFSRSDQQSSRCLWKMPWDASLSISLSPYTSLSWVNSSTA